MREPGVPDPSAPARDDRAISVLERALTAALGALQDGFFILDADWRFVFANGATGRSVGVEPQELLGHVLWERFPSLLGTPLEAAYRRAMAEGEPASIEVEGPVTGRWYRLGIAPIEAGLSVLWTDITDSKRAEEALRESQQKLSAVHDRAPFAIALTRLPDLATVSVNDAFVRLFGHPREEVVGRTSVDVGISEPEAQARVARELRERGVVRDLEVTRTTRGGEPRVLSLNLDRVVIAGREHVLTTIQDVTDRKLAEALLKSQLAAKEQLARIAASVPGAICTFQLRPDGTACMPFAAEPLDDLYGIPRETLARDMSPAFANLHPDDAPAVRAAIEASARAMTKWHAEFRYLHPVKGLRWIEGWSMPAREPDGSIVWHGYVTDVTERREAQDALRRSDEQLRLAKEAAQMGAWDWDLRTGELAWSDRCKALYGLPPETEMNYEVFLGAVDARDRGAVEDAVRSALSSRQPYDVEMRVPLPDGTVRWIASKGLGAYDEHGRPIRMSGMALDVTARKRAEERERAAAARDAFRVRLSDALRPLAEPPDIRATAARVLATFLGVARAAYAEVQDDEAVFAEDHRDAGLASLEGRRRLDDYGLAIGAEIRAGRTVVAPDVDGLALASEERTRYASLSVRAFVVVPLRKEGRVVAVLGVAATAPRPWSTEDVALVEEVAERTWAAVERARAESALREEGRRKDEFLAVLSHELRNPLAPIRNSVYLLERVAPGSEQAARAVAVLRRQTEHVTRLVDDLLDVTRISRGKIQLRTERLDLRDVVRRTVDDHQSLFDESGVELRVEHSGKPVWVEADATRISQVVANLVHNAVKFTPRGGAVTVAVVAKGGRAQLRVRDDGIGIEPSQLARMFEPFAQAEQGIARSKGGLGLGLALVKAVVDLHGGSVVARSDGPGHGAEFVVGLPLAVPEAEAEQDGQRAAHPSARDVLVIEDNVDAGQTLAELLSLLGHRVRVATNGRSGLALARERPPDVILCDIGLPDLDGYEVAKAIRMDRSLARTRLVALTGYAQPEDVQRALESGFDAHLAKPPAPEALERLLSE